LVIIVGPLTLEVIKGFFQRVPGIGFGGRELGGRIPFLSQSLILIFFGKVFNLGPNLLVCPLGHSFFNLRLLEGGYLIWGH